MLLVPLVGAVALLLMGVGHSLLGERYVVKPLLASELPRFMGSRSGMRSVIRVSWHLSTVAWWGVAAVLAYAATEGPDAVGGPALGVLGATLGVTAAIILVTSKGRHPAWLGFGTAAVCAWLTRA